MGAWEGGFLRGWGCFSLQSFIHVPVVFFFLVFMMSILLQVFFSSLSTTTTKLWNSLYTRPQKATEVTVGRYGQSTLKVVFNFQFSIFNFQLFNFLIFSFFTHHSLIQFSEKHDLHRETAFNLSLIYRASGNEIMARELLMTHCWV